MLKAVDFEGVYLGCSGVTYSAKFSLLTGLVRYARFLLRKIMPIMMTMATITLRTPKLPMTTPLTSTPLTSIM